ncbi:MAG TPA: FAD:protein FMN transferase [Ktedonobacterales bacterium]|nr:FAD:protein FMN transferase [Ktedonobacterales bacterium]
MSTRVATRFSVPIGMEPGAFHAMGTTISVLLPRRYAAAGLHTVQELFESWELTLSRFRAESELSRLNQHAGEPVAVSALLFHVLSSALLAAHVTEGRYDPTMQSQLARLGYDRSFDTLPNVLPADSRVARPGGGWRCIVINRTDRRVTLPEGVGLDVGGIAKGMAVDAAITRLARMGIASALVNAGGDLAVLGLPPRAEAWPLAVAGLNVSRTIALQHGAMATSGIGRRHWRQGERARHHLLDPRTGEPVQNDLWSVTVVASRCELAEVAAKAAFVAGVEQGSSLLREYGLAGLLTLKNESWRAVGAWPADDVEEHP